MTNLFEEVQNYIHNISARDYKLLEQMQNKYSDETILNLIKEYPGKPISYISKIQPKIKDKPYWLDMDIKEEKLTLEELQPILDEWKEFFDNDNEYQEWCKRQLKGIGVNKNDTMSKDNKDNVK